MRRGIRMWSAMERAFRNFQASVSRGGVLLLRMKSAIHGRTCPDSAMTGNVAVTGSAVAGVEGPVVSSRNHTVWRPNPLFRVNNQASLRYTSFPKGGLRRAKLCHVIPCVCITTVRSLAGDNTLEAILDVYSSVGGRRTARQQSQPRSCGGELVYSKVAWGKV